MTGALILLATLVIATAAGLWWRARAGRVRAGGAAPLPADVAAVLDPDAEVTLVQLSTTFCAPCRQTRVLLADLADRTDGLRHAELDLTDRPGLARELSVLRTPTTIAVDARGTELLRVGGVPRPDALLDALRPHLSHGLDTRPEA
ncbi:MAG TPA: thioredoxin family protein [Micromonosporaceae bacterium]|nr:thioredoxin family protein [Micromonosporaceae bacterium]